MDKRSFFEHAGAVICAPLLAAGVLLWTPLSSMETLARDALVRASTWWTPEATPGVPDVAVAAMDTASLSAFDDWPWPRSRYVELIRALEDAGALAIAFDIDFSTPRDPAQDAAFGTAIAKSGRVVLGAFRDLQEVPGVGHIEMVHQPLPVLSHGARLGSGMVPFDPDGTVRRSRPIAEIGGRRLASLALTTLSLVLSQEADLSDRPKQLLDFRHAKPEIPRFSIVDLLEGHVERSVIEGRAIFVGATAPVLQDLWKTPIDPRVPGVIIHAIEYRNHATEAAGRSALRDASLGAQLALALFVSLCMRVFGSGSHPRRIATAVGLAGAVPTATLGALVSMRVLFEPLSALLVVGVHYLWGLERVRVTIRRRLRAREESIDALVNIGKIASERPGLSQTQSALRLLGETATANWLVLIPADASGSFVGDAPTWARHGEAPEPNLSAARGALTSGELRTIVPSGGHALELYVPLATGAQKIGVLIAGYPANTQPDETEIRTVEAVAALIALAGTTDRLIHDLRDASEEAQNANRAKTDFLANISHEIRTPMNAVLGYTELLGDTKLPPDVREDMTRALRLNGEHVVALVDDILDLSRIETGDLQLNLALTDPVKLLREVEAMLRNQAIERGLMLVVSARERAPALIQTDPVRLRQVLVNLVSNAIKFTPEGSVRVRIGTNDGSDVEAGKLRFEVRDTGMGMSEEVRARVFDAFFQADSSSTRDRGGVGLGLAISQKLAGALGGGIEIESEPGQGSVFTLTVSAGRVEGPALRPAASPGAALSGRALVAEDGPDNQRIIRAFLRKAGLEVTIAENGQLALEAAIAARDAGEEFDIVFMDIAMPVMDGHEATRRLREAGFSTPIIAVTAHARDEDRDAALAAGCDDYMTKPLKRETLVEMSTRHLAEPKPGES